MMGVTRRNLVVSSHNVCTHAFCTHVSLTSELTVGTYDPMIILIMPFIHSLPSIYVHIFPNDNILESAKLISISSKLIGTRHFQKNTSCTQIRVREVLRKNKTGGMLSSQKTTSDDNTK